MKFRGKKEPVSKLLEGRQLEDQKESSTNRPPERESTQEPNTGIYKPCAHETGSISSNLRTFLFSIGYQEGFDFSYVPEFVEFVKDWTFLDYDVESDEWTTTFKQQDGFSVYSEFQFDIGGRLGAYWDKEIHGWRLPAITYSIKDLLGFFSREKEKLERQESRYSFGIDSYQARRLNYVREVKITDLAIQMIKVKRNLEERWEKLQKEAEAPEQIRDDLEEVQPKLKHQHNGIEFMLSHDAVLADDMGTGKTRQMLNVIYKLFEQEEISHAVVLCPTTTKGVWRTQAKQYFNGKMLPIVISSTNRFEERNKLLAAIYPRNKNSEKILPLYILGYETARVHPIELQNLLDDGVLILDECHKVKAPGSKITKMVTALRPKFVKPLSGTPIVNVPLDAFTIFNLVKPGLLGRSYDQFFTHFAYRDGRYGIKYHNLEEFNKRIQPYYIRRLKKDVLDLPDKIWIRDYEEIELGEQQKKIYSDMALKFAAEIEGISEENYLVSATNIVSRLLRLLQICDGYLSQGVGLGQEWISDSSKIKTVNEILDDYVQNGRKVIIWSRFLPPLEMLSVELLKYNPVVLHGGVPEERRGVGPQDGLDTVVGKFHHDSNCKVFLGQIHTGGQSIDLTCADTEILFDQWWSPGIMDQAIDRAHRIGQKNNVTIIPLVTNRTIEQYYFGYEFDKGNGQMVQGKVYQKRNWIETAIEGRNTILPSKSELLEWLRRV